MARAVSVVVATVGEKESINSEEAIKPINTRTGEILLKITHSYF